jgi:hypothetical protein
MEVDHRKREATVMLLGTEKEGNSASQLAFNKKEQELAKLERQTIFKPHSLSVMPLDKLYPNQGGHVSEATMQRVHTELARAVQDKTVSVTHLARDGTVSMYDMARQRPGHVILEAPPRNAAYEAGARPTRPPVQVYRAESSSSPTTTVREEPLSRPERVAPRTESVAERSATATRAVETTTHEASTVRRSAEVAETALEVARFAAKEGTKMLVGGPVGDAMAMADLSMAGFAFIDNHTGHAISQGPIGQGVKYLGEQTGAFKAIHEVAEKVQPYVDQAHRVMDPIVDRATAVAQSVADRTGVTAALNFADQNLGRAADWSSQQIANVQKGFADAARSAGFDAAPLTHDEARAVAAGLGAAKPGEAVALHPNGSMELLSANSKHAAQPGVLILDAQAFKEQMGLTHPSRETATQVAQVSPAPPAPPAREMMH